MSTFTSQTTFVVEDCCNCGIQFALTRDFYDRAQADNSVWFYCPNGHKQHYTEGKVQEANRKRREAEERLARELARSDQEKSRLRDQRDSARRQVIGQKAAKTRIKNRVAHGVCPCCNRTFKNLASHMKNQHPDYAHSDD